MQQPASWRACTDHRGLSKALIRGHCRVSVQTWQLRCAPARVSERCRLGRQARVGNLEETHRLSHVTACGWRRSRHAVQKALQARGRSAMPGSC